MEQSSPQPGFLRNLLIGQRIGSYRVLDTLGSGGMSTVFRAVHVDSGHEVALKVLLGSFSRSSTLLQRFLREARSAETLEHSSIVTIYDRGVDQGRHYLVLEYVAGGDFHEYIQRNGPLDVAEALAVARGIASGLRYAAGRGVIHRDIKPSNILRSPQGDPKIIDLGLALQAEFEDERVTREGTTVGTVDYMAPEQARDSRATSIHSDMYSLGCTFYYLLAGIPPFPGGDITEKLTRHARAPAPDIRDLRPEIPPEVSAIVLRLMAKQPEERYADYDQLIAAIDVVGRAGGDGATIALVPLEGEETPDRPAPSLDRRPGPNAPAAGPARFDEDPGTMPLEPLGGLSLELADERETEGRRADAPEAPLPRLGRATTPDDEDDEDDEASEDAEAADLLAQPGEAAFPRWILHTGLVAALAVLLVVGLHLFLGPPRLPDSSLVEIPDPAADADSIRSGDAPEPYTARPTTKRPDGGGPSLTKADAAPRHPEATPRPSWIEPEDRDPIAGEIGPIPAEIQRLRGRLPDWTRAPAPTKPEDPVVVVRRFPDPADGPTEPTLHSALDRHRAGAVELADIGPLSVDDLWMSGESRVVRARRGYRPVIRIARSRTGPAMEHSAFVPLERKSLTLEGIDLIVDARDLSGNQTALFGCSGSSLTLRDCTITVINPATAANPAGVPFTLIRQDSGPRRERPSRILLERTLVRGSFVTLFELAGGAADLVIDETAILVGGAGRPLVRVARLEGPEDPQRIFLAGALLLCPGPVIRCERPEGAPAQGKPLAVRSDGSAFGRLQGAGIASVIAASDDRAQPDRVVEWSGDLNLFAGWMGFFARGPRPTITVDDLAQARFTWNATEQGSQWVLLDWPIPSDPARLVAAGMSPFLPGRQALMAGPARPGIGLFPRTLEVYPDPIVPEVAATEAPAPPGPVGFAIPSRKGAVAMPTAPGMTRPGERPTEPAVAPRDELVMKTDDPRWGGDLGAFLRESIGPGARRARVVVVGSGAHRATPVRLPDGLTLELRVERDPGGSRLPSWSPDPQSTGPGLIEVHRGALILSNLVLRHDPSSGLESLLCAADSHLVLRRCQLTVPPDVGGPSGDLIAFRAPTTRPMPDHPGNAAFLAPVDRPVCRLIDTILIARRTAIRAQVGRGLIAMTGCAVASDETAIELEPSRVSRRAFEADLWLDRCTLVAGRSILGLGPWPGVASGPDRPWLINSRRSVFLTLSDGKSRDAALLRVDADAYAGGGLFWQADGDAMELDRVVSGGEVPSSPSRRGEVGYQWEQLFWPSNRATRTVLGPRAAGPRLPRRPRPGRIEPADLALGAIFPGGRGAPGVADLSGPGPMPPTSGAAPR